MDLITFLHIIVESGFAVFCLIAVFYIRVYREGPFGNVDVLAAALVVNAAINLADSLAYVYRGDTTEVGYYAVRISNFIVFAGMFVLLAIGNQLLDTMLKERGSVNGRRLRGVVYALSAAGVLLNVLSLFFHFLYSFDDNNVYQRGAVYPVLPVLAGAALIILVIRTFSERGSLSRKEYHGLMCIWLLPAFGSAVQVLYYGIAIANICNSLALIIMATVVMRSTIDTISIKRSFILNGESIERLSNDLERFLIGSGYERQNRIRIRFTVEEALLNIWKHFGDLSMVKVIAGFRLGKPSIRIEHTGEAFNPFSKTKTGLDEWSMGLLAAAGISPGYNYSHGVNIMKIPMRRVNINPVIKVVMSIALGLITGTVAMRALSEGDAMFVAEGVLTPVYDLWNNMLFSVSAPAMLIIVMSTVLDTREVSEQGGNAGKTTGRYFLISLAVGIFTTAAASLILRYQLTYYRFSRGYISELIRDLFSAIPENLLDPIRDFNAAQLMVIGILFAYAVMAVGQNAGGIAALIHELNLVMMQIAQWISALAPIFTVFLIAQLVLRRDALLLALLITIIPFAAVISMFVVAVTLLIISRRSGVRPRVLLKKLRPSFIHTLKSGLDDESYALSEKCCTKSLGIQRIFTQRMLPLGMVLYMPAGVVGMLSFVLFAAVRDGVEITLAWILTAVVLSLILLVAAPPIPGVNLLSYVVIIAQLGIGKEYVVAAMVFDILYDAFASAANQMMLQLDIIQQAEHMGLLNRNVLRKDI